MEEIKGEIEFKNVNFGYNQDKIVLKDVSFKVKAGETVAILGPTGAGKSTLVNLIPRLLEPISGEILLDKVPLSKISKHSLRKKVGIILQEPFLFSKTIADNIAL